MASARQVIIDLSLIFFDLFLIFPLGLAGEI